MARKAIYKHATQVDTSSYPDDGSSPVGTNEWNESPDPEGMIGNTPQTASIAIASGALLVTDSVCVVTGESGAADDLDKITITNTNEYDLLYIFGQSAYNVTLKNTASPSVAGQITTISGADEILSATVPTILIRKGNFWYGYGGGTTADGSITTAKLADNSVTSAKIVDGAIVNADVNASAAIAQSKIASLTTDLGLKAPLASPTFTGTTTAAAVTVTGALTGTLTGNASGSSGSCTGNSATVTTNANLTGIVTSTGNATAIANGAIAIAKLATDPLSYANMTAPSASVAFNSQKLTGLADGTAAQDAATKSQVDAAQAGLDAKDSCRVATTANITLSGEQTIDGVTTTTDRVLVKNQTAGAQNGIYVSAAGAWARSTDTDANAEVTAGLYTLITEGTVAGGQGFVLTTDDPITVGTTALVFSQFSGVGDLVGGTGITKVGNTINVDAVQTQITDVGALDAGSITSGFGNINIGSSTITTSGAITTGAITAPSISGSSGSCTGNSATATTATTVSANAIGITQLAGIPRGKIIVGDASGDPALLTVGAEDTVLTVDANGDVGWEAPSGGGAHVTQEWTATTAPANPSTGTGIMYMKTIDSNNEGLFMKMRKNNQVVEVQIA